MVSAWVSTRVACTSPDQSGQEGMLGLDEDRESAAALSPPHTQSLFLREELRAIFLERGESRSESCSHPSSDPRTESALQWKPWKHGHVAPGPTRRGGKPPSPAGARRRSEQHFQMRAGHTSVMNKKKPGNKEERTLGEAVVTTTAQED